jgi:uridine kinase
MSAASAEAPAVLLIDGRSGSGKTVLAARISAGSGAQTLHVEDLYLGWEGLAAGSLSVSAALDRGKYQRYDWIAGEFAEKVRIDPASPLVIEGCGAITDENLAAARRWAERSGLPGGVRGIWLECPEQVRRERALARDGEMFAPYWESWAAQEDVHFALHEPWRLADEIISTGGIISTGPA